MKRTSGYTLLRAAIVAAFVILVGRLWYMQVVQVDAYRAQAVASKTSFPRYVLAPRGIIYDRYGRPLVRNLPRLQVTVYPENWSTSHSRAESELLAHLLHGKPSARRIRAMIAYAVSYDPSRPVTIKPNITLHTFYVIRTYADQLPGVDTGETLSHRFYLGQAPWPLAHITGYVLPINAAQYQTDKPGGLYGYQRYTYQDLVGQTGIEAAFEHELHGVNGVQTSQVDAIGNQITPWKTVSRAIPGDGIRLTVDSHFEEQVAQDLQAGLQKLGVKEGSAVVMDPWNGQILAMVSLPSFNPNVFTAAPSVKRTREINALTKESPQPQFDISTMSALPPGSIYKVITATAGLESGVITPSTTIDDTGILKKCPACSPKHGWMPPPGLGEVDIVKAIARSSDIYFYEVAGGGPDLPGNGLGPYRFDRWARRYGLGQYTGIQLPDRQGIVPGVKELRYYHHQPWSYGDSYNMGIGQGDTEVTPLQMARVVSVIANGGSLVRPSVVEGITGPNGKRILPGHNYGLVPDVVRPHFVAPWVTSLIGQGMRMGVQWDLGTSFGEVDQRTDAAGKTGTAQTPQGIAAWWMGFAPYNHPKIAVVVTVPTANSEGAFAAAPIASKIILDYMHKPAANWLSKVRVDLLGGFN